jgi:peptidoglycan hydrolase-like protein with peptidoglycan-binding domain
MPDIYPQKITSGYFGELTKAAVGAFQIKQGIVSGVAQGGYGGVGPLTYAKLLAMCPK